MFHEGGPYEGHDQLFWWTSLPSHGPLQGEVCAAPVRRMRRDSGDVEVVPD